MIVITHIVILILLGMLYLENLGEEMRCDSFSIPTKQWVLGVIAAAVPIQYGISCILGGQTTFFGGRGGNVQLTGNASFWLAIAYISIGAFCHFHYFWKLSEKLCRFSEFLKALSLIIFLPSFLYAMFLGLV